MRPYSQFLHDMRRNTPPCQLNLGGSTPPFTKDATFFDGIQFSTANSNQLPELQRLREILAEKQNAKPAEFHFAPGSSQVYTQLLATITKPGDTILLDTPNYEPFAVCAKFLQLKIKYFKRTRDFNRDLKEIKKLARGVRVIAISNPNCPTGQMYPAEFLIPLSKIFPHVIVDEDFVPLFTDGRQSLLPGERPKNLYTIGSFSKSLGLSMLRLGWLRAPAQVTDLFDRMANNFHIDMPNPSIQLGLRAAEHWGELIQPNLMLANANRPLLQQWEEEHPLSLSHDFSNGFFGLLRIPKDFKDGEAFSKEILKLGIYLKPGRLFRAPKHVRLHILVSPKEFVKVWDQIISYYD
jgi:histidinol-phosphate/aromatic aminotransferase/cobyric acid decarboxylase-like protein